MTTRSRLTAAISACFLLSSAGPVLAQDAAAEPNVRDVVRFLVLNRGVRTDDPARDLEAAEATHDTLTRALLASVATTPIGTSSGGFTYRLNPTIGTVERASDTFGSFYLERALTSGAGQASFGATFQYARYERLDGNDLRNGEFVTVATTLNDETVPFDRERLQLRMSSRTTTFFANVGVNDRVDVGVALPLVQLRINGLRVNDYRDEVVPQARASAVTTGFADIAVRTKVRLTPIESQGAIAAGVEARLPTGREEDLLGTGDLAMRFLGIASYEANRAGVYGNFILGTGGVGREVSYGGGVSLAAASRFTIVGEVMLRRIAGIQNIVPDAQPHPRLTSPPGTTTRLVPSGEDVTTGFSVVGFKWNVGGRWLVNTNVQFPLNDNGLTSRFTPAFSVDYSFGR